MADKLIIEGLTRADRNELRTDLGADQVSFDEPELRPGAHGQLGAIIGTIVVTRLALAALAVWWSKQNRRLEAKSLKAWSLKKSVKIKHPDGTEEEHTIEVAAESEDTFKQGIAQKLADLFKFDFKELIGLMKETK
jgi:hypothetical protein